MFNSVTNLTSEAKSDLYNENTLLDKGEAAIEEGNDNNRTKEILENVELYEKKVNELYKAIGDIEANIASLRSDINTSMQIRQQEDKEDEMTWEDEEEEYGSR